MDEYAQELRMVSMKDVRRRQRVIMFPNDLTLTGSEFQKSWRSTRESPCCNISFNSRNKK